MTYDAEKDYDESVEEQWRVIWFAPEGDRTFTGSETAVRRKADSAAVKEWNPIIETRSIVVQPWRDPNDRR